MIEPFVTRQWLRAQSASVVLADVRWYPDGRSARQAYDAGHLPGAVYVDESDIADPPSDAGGRHPLPSPGRFAAAMSAVGIGNDSVVVAYDDAGGVIAGRLVWMLRALRCEAALLDGGLVAWGGPLSTEASAPTPAVFTAAPWPQTRLATIADAADRSLVVVDARPAERYRGGPDDLDPRSGHIPGARSLPCRENLADDTSLLPREQLRARFAAVGVAAEVPVVSYCGSGVTACHNLLVMEQLGLGPGRLFTGSWSQWSRDPDRPAATGPDPG